MTERIVVVTGAGVSVPSGIRPFRGPGGLWTENPELEYRTSLEDFGSGRAWMSELEAAEPNRIHTLLASLENEANKVIIVTQNVDGLHQKAGSTNVLEMHGSVFYAACVRAGRPGCQQRPWPNLIGSKSACPTCGSGSRPDVVLFGEDVRHLDRAKLETAMAEVFMAVGTSGMVWPASDLVALAQRARRKILINKEPWEHPHPDFTETYIGPAEDILPKIIRELAQ